MDVLVAKIIGNFVKKGIVKEIDASIYAFGLRQGMTITINILTIFVVGIILGELLNLIVFSVSYLMLRPYAGGYHAESEIGCYIFSTLMMVVVAIISKIISLNIITVVIMLVISNGILIYLAPVEDNRKPLDEMEVKVYREKLRTRLYIENLIAITGMYLFDELFEMMVVAIMTIAYMNLLGWISNKIGVFQKV